ncbi:phage portal protein [Peptostreptococcus porci]|uniref:phage portal protein n=1 Tax=Peptostreptococcus porci TaxID=2652282 RepID=UPI002A9161F6|nr:phage portal protein [Peptostreptococcus porci]MDY6232824.1 phage portal protein [Peptostreptococcus porci]
MGIINTFKGFFGNSMENITSSNDTVIDIGPGEFDLMMKDISSSKIGFMEYSITVCINKIANALSQCQFDTFTNGKSEQNNMWYLFNVEPNLNQNVTDFWNKLVFQMVTDPKGALVVQTYEGYLLIADSYSIDEYAVRENIYSNIVVNKLNMNRVFQEYEVLHLKLSNKNIKEFVSAANSIYEKILVNTIKDYQRRKSKKIFVNIKSMFNQFKNKINPETGKSEYDETLDNLFKNRLKAYFSDSDCAIPIEEGLEIDDRTKEFSSSKYKETDDIRALFDDMLNLCADAFNIPRGLLKGDVADVEAMTDNFITFCMNPIASLIEDEINRKLYGKEKVLSGTKIKIKTASIKGYDPLKLANAAEALYRIRSVNTNWVRKMLREEPIKEAWAEEYMETKNYQNVKGGVDSEKN